MNKVFIVGLLVLLLAASPALAATITVGNHDFLPGEVRWIPINVTGADPVDLIQGVDFYVQVADGGPENITRVPAGSIDGPEITAVDLINSSGNGPTIFSPNNTGQNTPPGLPQVAVAFTTTSTGTVAAQGTLAWVEIDTKSFPVTDPNNPWELVLTGTDGEPRFDTVFAPPSVPLTIVNGTITIIPEPATLVMLVGLLGAVVLLRRRA